MGPMPAVIVGEVLPIHHVREPGHPAVKIPVKKDPGIQNRHADAFSGESQAVSRAAADLIFNTVHMQDSSILFLLPTGYS